MSPARCLEGCARILLRAWRVGGEGVAVVVEYLRHGCSVWLSRTASLRPTSQDPTVVRLARLGSEGSLVPLFLSSFDCRAAVEELCKSSHGAARRGGKDELRITDHAQCTSLGPAERRTIHARNRSASLCTHTRVIAAVRSCAGTRCT